MCNCYIYFILFFVQGKKFVDESKSLMEQISKLEELLSSKRHILQVYIMLNAYLNFVSLLYKILSTRLSRRESYVFSLTITCYFSYVFSITITCSIFVLWPRC